MCLLFNRDALAERRNLPSPFNRGSKGETSEQMPLQISAWVQPWVRTKGEGKRNSQINEFWGRNWRKQEMFGVCVCVCVSYLIPLVVQFNKMVHSMAAVTYLAQGSKMIPGHQASSAQSARKFRGWGGQNPLEGSSATFTTHHSDRSSSKSPYKYHCNGSRVLCLIWHPSPSSCFHRWPARWWGECYKQGMEVTVSSPPICFQYLLINHNNNLIIT